MDINVWVYVISAGWNISFFNNHLYTMTLSFVFAIVFKNAFRITLSVGVTAASSARHSWI